MRSPSVPKVPGSFPLTTLWICSAHVHVQVTLRGYCLVNGERITASQLGIPFLTLLSVAVSGRDALGSVRLTTSVAQLKVVNIFSSLGRSILAILETYLYLSLNRCLFE